MKCIIQKKKKRCEIPTGVATKIKNPRLEVTVILHSSTPRVSNNFSKKKKKKEYPIKFPSYSCLHMEQMDLKQIF